MRQSAACRNTSNRANPSFYARSELWGRDDRWRFLSSMDTGGVKSVLTLFSLPIFSFVVVEADLNGTVGPGFTSICVTGFPLVFENSVD